MIVEAIEADDDACPYVLGSGGLARLGRAEARAWRGLLRAHRQLTRELDAALKQRFGLTLSSLELLGQLADAHQQRMRIARLAERTQLSVSRTSRLLDSLERRGLLVREPCPEDSRASNAALTAAGAQLAREAQASHLADLQRLFFDRLSARQIETLAAAFEQLVPQAAQVR